MSLEQNTHHQIQLLALHGFTGCGLDFAALQTGSIAQWHCPDLPGHLSETQRKDCSPQATLNYLLEHAQKLTRPRVLLGYSMGARAALQLMAHQLDSWDALILISGNPGLSDPVERALRRQNDLQMARRIETIGLSNFLTEWQAMPIIQTQKNIPASIRKSMQLNRLKHTASGLAMSLRQFGVAVCPDLWPMFSAIHCPILSITGSKDPKYGQIADKMQQLNAQVQVVTVDAVGHTPHLEAVDRCTPIIENFLQKIVTGKSHWSKGTNA